MGKSIIASIEYKEKTYRFDLHKPLDISIPVRAGEGVSAWKAGRASLEPFRAEGFIGKVSEGASVNFVELRFHPHAHGTHTEGPGHITEAGESVYYPGFAGFHFCKLVSVSPLNQKGDYQISKNLLIQALEDQTPAAVIIRTLPNTDEKKVKDYSGTNPPYLTKEAVEFLVGAGVQHLLVDLPSVDKEEDGGLLAAHRAFWQMDKQLRGEATITELVYVPDSIKDGLYLLNLQLAPVVNDASPSRPVLFKPL